MIGLQFIKITPPLLRSLCSIDEFKGYWIALDDHTVGLNLIGDVAAHGARFKKVLEPLQQHDLTLDIVKALHSTVSSHDQRGQFKKDESTLPFFQDGKMIGELDTAHPDDVPEFLDKLLVWVNKDIHLADIHPVLIVSVFMAVFLQISPFRSENLKLARLLVVLLLLKSGYRYVGFVSLDPLMDRYGAMMYSALRDNQISLEEGQPDWQAWLDCMTTILSEQTQILASKIEGERAAEDFAGMTALSLRLLECIKANKRTTMKEMLVFTKGRRATIKLRLQELLQAGMIKRYGAGRGVWYSLV